MSNCHSEGRPWLVSEVSQRHCSPLHFTFAGSSSQRLCLSSQQARARRMSVCGDLAPSFLGPGWFFRVLRGSLVASVLLTASQPERICLAAGAPNVRWPKLHARAVTSCGRRWPGGSCVTDPGLAPLRVGFGRVIRVHCHSCSLPPSSDRR